MGRTTNSRDEANAYVPPHVADTVDAISRFHAAHRAEAVGFQRFIEYITRQVGRPTSTGWLTLVIIGWIAGNLALSASGREPIDTPPFAWLEGFVALSALYMTIFILATQSRADELAALREQLTLEHSILSEQKSAKIIELLEELRRDSPAVENRADEHADAMSTPADPDAVLAALKQSETD